MATPAAPVPPQPAPTGLGAIFANPVVRQLAQGLLIYQVVSLVFKGKQAISPTTPGVQTHDAPGANTAQPAQSANQAGQAQPAQRAGQNGQAAQQVPPLIPVWQPKTLLDVSLKLTVEEDPLAVDLGDASVPGVTWEGVEWSNSGWEKVWETEWDVPEVRSLRFRCFLPHHDDGGSPCFTPTVRSKQRYFLPRRLHHPHRSLAQPCRPDVPFFRRGSSRPQAFVLPHPIKTLLSLTSNLP
jgi:hypothetical protein